MGTLLGKRLIVGCIVAGKKQVKLRLDPVGQLELERGSIVLEASAVILPKVIKCMYVWEIRGGVDVMISSLWKFKEVVCHELVQA